MKRTLKKIRIFLVLSIIVLSLIFGGYYVALSFIDQRSVMKNFPDAVTDYTYIISTVAGSGRYGYSGDGGPAEQACLNVPYDAAIDRAGNLYIADTGNNRIRRIDVKGDITTIAGNGQGCYRGDGGPALLASLWGPSRLAVDDIGNIYIADSGNRRIRKVDTRGIITTLIGNGEVGCMGGNCPADQAILGGPTDVAVDKAGNVYIADGICHRVRKVDTRGVITVLAGNGNGGFSGDGSPAVQAGLCFPAGVAIDEDGSVYIADKGNNRIRKVDVGGIITTVAGNGKGGSGGDGGLAIKAGLWFPYDVATDAAGNIYIADLSNHRIRVVDSYGMITTLAGDGKRGYWGDGGPAVQAGLNHPRSVAIDGHGNLYIAESDNNRIRKVSLLSGPAGNN
jgi:sugar lactone lactonase YvrE